MPIELIMPTQFQKSTVCQCDKPYNPIIKLLLMKAVIQSLQIKKEFPCCEISTFEVVW